MRRPLQLFVILAFFGESVPAYAEGGLLAAIRCEWVRLNRKHEKVEMNEKTWTDYVDFLSGTLGSNIKRPSSLEERRRFVTYYLRSLDYEFTRDLFYSQDIPSDLKEIVGKHLDALAEFHTRQAHVDAVRDRARNARSYLENQSSHFKAYDLTKLKSDATNAMELTQLGVRNFFKPLTHLYSGDWRDLALTFLQRLDATDMPKPNKISLIFAMKEESMMVKLNDDDRNTIVDFIRARFPEAITRNEEEHWGHIPEGWRQLARRLETEHWQLQSALDRDLDAYYHR